MAKKQKKKAGKKQKSSWRVNLFLAVLFFMGLMFMSSALILFIGLLPMIVAFFTDRNTKKTRAVTVGAMNLAGCAPFILELWTTEPTMDKAVSIIADPMAIIVMYSAAGVGYIIDWALTKITSNLMYQRGTSRVKDIEKRQQELIERWGEEVNGKIPLDHEGFPVSDAPPVKAEK